LLRWRHSHVRKEAFSNPHKNLRHNPCTVKLFRAFGLLWDSAWVFRTAEQSGDKGINLKVKPMIDILVQKDILPSLSGGIGPAIGGKT
tara:strand:- start:1800 stop:2063 length:264 start_codon:yes stop_codon:yes gene_type:complete